MSLHRSIDIILVPKGAEHQAVCRGLRSVPVTIRPSILPIPVGPMALQQQLQTWQQMAYFAQSHAQSQRVLMMGLCGAMTPQYAVGEAVLYEGCIYRSNEPPVLLPCDRLLTTQLQEKLLQEKLPTPIPRVTGLTSDRLIWSAQEKRDLAQEYGTDVVDMESFTALQILSQCGVAVAVLRVVSDGNQQDIPDLTPAISPEGTIQPLPLILKLFRQPIAASHLIRGTLQGLRTLQVLTHILLSETQS